MGDAGENTSLEKVNQVVLNEHGCNKIFSFLCSYVILYDINIWLTNMQSANTSYVGVLSAFTDEQFAFKSELAIPNMRPWRALPTSMGIGDNAELFNLDSTKLLRRDVRHAASKLPRGAFKLDQDGWML
jgi:hypothetical protein